MPELPEVETITKGLNLKFSGKTCTKIVFHRKDLRYPIPQQTIRSCCLETPILSFKRRAKYILMETQKGSIVFHLGMTGSIHQEVSSVPLRPHTHAVFSFYENKQKKVYLHYVDPRRFGLISAIKGAVTGKEKYFQDLGLEPLEHKNLGKKLMQLGAHKKQAIKKFIMDSKIIVGVGNIYASESLYEARVHPETPAGNLKNKHFIAIGLAIQKILRKAIKEGGTTLKDYVNTDGKPGYFKQKLKVYDREQQPCLTCKQKIVRLVQGGRSTFFCPYCQKEKK